MQLDELKKIQELLDVNYLAITDLKKEVVIQTTQFEFLQQMFVDLEQHTIVLEQKSEISMQNTKVIVALQTDIEELSNLNCHTNFHLLGAVEGAEETNRIPVKMDTRGFRAEI